jgi:cell division septum initiation protein DivIVA
MKRLIACLCFLALPVLADTPPQEPQTVEDWERLERQAEEMRAQAKQLRTDARKTHDETHQACWKKFLVSSCQDEARQALRAAEREARRLDVEAGRIERRVLAHAREERMAKRAAERERRQLPLDGEAGISAGK